MFLEDSLIYFPSKYPEGDWTPGDLSFEDAWFEAADGTKLHGWYVPKKGTGSTRSEVPVPFSNPILFCHGNAGNITDRADIMAELHGKVEPPSWSSIIAVTAEARASPMKRASWPMRGPPGLGWQNARTSPKKTSS